VLIFISSVKDSVANYESILTLFPPSVVLYNGLNVSYIRRYVAPEDSQICGGKFPNRKKIGRSLVPNMITTEIVINSTRVMGMCDNIVPVCIVRHGKMLLSSYRQVAMAT